MKNKIITTVLLMMVISSMGLVSAGIEKEDNQAPFIQSIFISSRTPFEGTNILVTAVVFDNVGVTKVIADRTPMICEMDGKWRAIVPVRKGENVVLVVAQDDVGNSVLRESISYTAFGKLPQSYNEHHAPTFINATLGDRYYVPIAIPIPTPKVTPKVTPREKEDNQAPFIQSILISSRTPFEGTNILVTATIFDNVGVTKATADSTPMTCGNDGKWRAIVPVRKGENVVLVVAQDDVGNSVLRESISYTAFDKPPQSYNDGNRNYDNDQNIVVPVPTVIPTATPEKVIKKWFWWW